MLIDFQVIEIWIIRYLIVQNPQLKEVWLYPDKNSC